MKSRFLVIVLRLVALFFPHLANDGHITAIGMIDQGKSSYVDIFREGFGLFVVFNTKYKITI